jgi:hypothetical protein
MPIGRGIMQANRFNIYPTQTVFSLVSPSGPQPCGTSINFLAAVVNTKTNSFPTGTVSLIDETGAVLATSVLHNSTPFGTSASDIMNITLTAGNHIFHLEYSGDINKFAPSISSDLPYSGSFINSLMFFPALDNSAAPKFCYSQPFDVQVRVQPTSGSFDPTGVVNFKLYSDNITSVNLPSASLVGQFATTTIPAFTTDSFISNVGNFYVQGLYVGNDCFSPNQTDPGISIFSDIEAISNITTTTTITPGTTTFCIHRAKTFSGTVSRSITTSQAFNVGLVTLTANQGPTTITLGTTSLISGGTWSLLVPSNTFTATGGWFVTANYSDGYCYLNSTSSAVAYNGTELTTSPTVTFTAGPHTFNNDITAVFTVNVSSGGFNADNGDVHFRSYNNSNVLQLDLGTAPVNGVGNATISVPPGTFGSSSQYLTATYEHSSINPGCFSDNVSAHYVTTITEVI